MNEIKEEIHHFQRVLREYFELRIELLQLNTYDLITTLGARFSGAFILALAVLTTLLFLGIGLSFLIGEMLNSYALGFFITGAFNLLLIFIGVIFKNTLITNPIRLILLKWIIRKRKH